MGLGTPSALAFDSSGERLAVGTRTGLISIYAAPAGILQQRWQAADREIMAMAFTGDGNHLLTGDAAGILSIWNPATAVSIATLDTGVRDPHQIAMAPDALVAAILTLNPVTNRSENSIWDVATGTLLHLRSSPFPVTALVPNGDSFAIGETDGAVEIFPVSGDGAISIESIHDGFVQSVALVGGASPRYVSAGAGRIQLQGYDLPSELSGWNSATRVAATTTSRDGRIVLTGDFTGAITMADLNEPSLTRISDSTATALSPLPSAGTAPTPPPPP